MSVNLNSDFNDLRPEPWTEEENLLLNAYISEIHKTDESEERFMAYRVLHKTKTNAQILNKRRIIEEWGINNRTIKIVSSRIGTRNMMNNGLIAKIIRYGDAYSIDVEFEDGTIAESDYFRFKHRSCVHPGLLKRGNSVFCGYSTKYIGSDNEGNVWYETEKDGAKSIMTPQMMLKKSRVCQ